MNVTLDNIYSLFERSFDYLLILDDTGKIDADAAASSASHERNHKHGDDRHKDPTALRRFSRLGRGGLAVLQFRSLFLFFFVGHQNGTTVS